MIQAKSDLLDALAQAVRQLLPDAAYTPAFESPKQASHGDYAITAAMQWARPLKRNPRELAAALVEALQAQPAVQRWVDADPGVPARLAALHPIGRIGQPEEVAAVVLWLCSAGASFVTGHAHTVDGGFTIV